LPFAGHLGRRRLLAAQKSLTSSNANAMPVSAQFFSGMQESAGQWQGIAVEVSE